MAVPSWMTPPPEPAATMPVTYMTHPDYASLAQSDPIYTNWLSSAQSRAGQAGTQRQAAVRALALTYGGLPQGFSDVYGDLSPDMLAQAAANPESTQAQQARSYAAAQQSLQSNLAARGALHSGDLVQGQTNLDQQNADQLYAAAQQFGSDYGTLTGQQGYAGQIAGIQAEQPGILGQATQAEQAANPTQSISGSASLDPNWIAKYGQPVYTAPDGSLYSIDSDTGSLVPLDPSEAYVNPGYATQTQAQAPSAALGVNAGDLARAQAMNAYYGLPAAGRLGLAR